MTTLRTPKPFTQDQLTDHLEETAIRNIIEDHLLLGYSYPEKGGKHHVTAGMVIEAYSNEDDIQAMLSTLVSSNPTIWREYAENIVKQHGPQYLREEHPDLIDQMLEEMEDSDD